LNISYCVDFFPYCSSKLFFISPGLTGLFKALIFSFSKASTKAFAASLSAAFN